MADSDTDAPIAGTGYRVNPLLADRVNRLIAEAPADIKPDLEHAITSGYRDHEKQAAAYAHYLNGGGLAAPPGHSWHERNHGLAVDWNRITPRAWPYLKDNAYRYGLGFPLGSRDPFHMQPVETYAGGPGARASMMESRGAVPREIEHDAKPARSIAEQKPAAAPLPVEPINGVPFIGGDAEAGTHSIVTAPAPLSPIPRIQPMKPVTVPRAPDLASRFGNAMRTIFRS